MSAYEALPCSPESGYWVESDSVDIRNWIWIWIKSFLPLISRKILYQYSPASQSGDQGLHQMRTDYSELGGSGLPLPAPPTPTATHTHIHSRHWRMNSLSLCPHLYDRASTEAELMAWGHWLSSPASSLGIPLLLSGLCTAATTVHSVRALGWWPLVTVVPPPSKWANITFMNNNNNKITPIVFHAVLFQSFFEAVFQYRPFILCSGSLENILSFDPVRGS